jgi:hypothetical protein
MAAKHLEQAIALKDREAPLVQVKGPGSSTMEEFIGKNTILKSPVDGVIKKIDKDYIHIKTKFTYDLFIDYILHHDTH